MEWMDDVILGGGIIEEIDGIEYRFGTSEANSNNHFPFSFGNMPGSVCKAQPPRTLSNTREPSID